MMRKKKRKKMSLKKNEVGSMKWFGLIALVLVLATPLVAAYDFDNEISAEDKKTFEDILEPVIKVYNLIKYSASVIAVLVMLFAGIVYMTAGNDPRKRDQAKNMAGYVIIGLILIWAAPLIVDFIVN